MRDVQFQLRFPSGAAASAAAALRAQLRDWEWRELVALASAVVAEHERAAGVLCVVAAGRTAEAIHQAVEQARASGIVPES